MAGEQARDRRVFEITGDDRIGFLQGLVTNDVERLSEGIVYAALLTPQGKYLADFFIVPWEHAVLIDVAEIVADDLLKRFNMYRLRAAVQIAPSSVRVQRGLGHPPEGAFADPRDPSLGWRLYCNTDGEPAKTDWDALRVAACIPETGIELIPGDTLILEAGFERLNGVDHRKGCYVGQEVTARMKHKTELRKGLGVVEIEGDAPVGAKITAGGKPAGTLFTQSGGRAIAHLRYDRAGPDMEAGQARVHWKG